MNLNCIVCWKTSLNCYYRHKYKEKYFRYNWIVATLFPEVENQISWSVSGRNNRTQEISGIQITHWWDEPVYLPVLKLALNQFLLQSILYCTQRKSVNRTLLDIINYPQKNISYLKEAQYVGNHNGNNAKGGPNHRCNWLVGYINRRSSWIAFVFGHVLKQKSKIINLPYTVRI